jgi:hypothetical protein
VVELKKARKTSTLKKAKITFLVELFVELLAAILTGQNIPCVSQTFRISCNFEKCR